jgi:hypothetical protein
MMISLTQAIRTNMTLTHEDLIAEDDCGITLDIA